MWLNLLFWIFIRLFKCQPRWEIIFILFTQRLQLDLEPVFLIIRLDKFESKKLACRRRESNLSKNIFLSKLFDIIYRTEQGKEKSERRLL